MIEFVTSLFRAKIDTESLMQLCRRSSTSLRAGVDARSNWAREAANAHGWARRPMETIHGAVSRGQSFADALQQTGEYFPQLFRELAAVGEQTGYLAEVFDQLASHYEHQLALKRAFRSAIAWPVIQFIIALLVVGLLIWIGAVLPKQANGQPIDILGFGLVGEHGLIVYGSFLAAVACAGLILYRQISRGVWWGDRAQQIAMRIPKIGGALQSLALAHLCWSLRMTLDTDMPVKRALELSFSATRNAYYTRHLPDVLLRIRQGQPIADTLASTNIFPRDFLNAVTVGEQSGRLPETLEVLSDEYQDQARRATRTLTMAAGALVWLLVAGVIIMLIFRIAGMYIGAIKDAEKGL